jgi:hydrogenase maturation factor
MGRVRVGHAFLRVPLTFLIEAHIGDTVLVESGVAISRVEPNRIADELGISQVVDKPGLSAQISRPTGRGMKP